MEKNNFGKRVIKIKNGRAEIWPKWGQHAVDLLIFDKGKRTAKWRGEFRSLDHAIEYVSRHENPVTKGDKEMVTRYNPVKRESAKKNPVKRKLTEAQEKQLVKYGFTKEMRNSLLRKMREGFSFINARDYVGYGFAKRNPATLKTPDSNPVKRKLTARPKPAGKLDRKVFTVQSSENENGPWKTEGFFPSEDQAREYAAALDKKYSREMWIRVTV